MDQAEDEQNAEDEQSKARTVEDIILRGACQEKTAQAKQAHYPAQNPGSDAVISHGHNFLARASPLSPFE
jgi:hypothetical protein